MQRLVGKKALITGGTAGIGKAIATRFVEEGAEVVIVGTNRERGERVAEEIGVQFVQLDVSQYDDVKGVFADLGAFHILVNNAGITRDQLLMKLHQDDWDRVIAVNLKSCYNTSQALIRSMIKERYGRIINVSSVVGLIGNPGQTNYAASKAGMIGFTKALAKEVASRGITANVICPGFIETEMTEELFKTKGEAIAESIPMKRFGTTQEIAALATFLASDDASYITGQVWAVDGGLAM